jgi:hypothetical protein
MIPAAYPGGYNTGTMVGVGSPGIAGHGLGSYGVGGMTSHGMTSHGMTPNTGQGAHQEYGTSQMSQGVYLMPMGK